MFILYGLQFKDLYSPGSGKLAVLAEQQNEYKKRMLEMTEQVNRVEVNCIGRILEHNMSP